MKTQSSAHLLTAALVALLAFAGCSSNSSTTHDGSPPRDGTVGDHATADGTSNDADGGSPADSGPTPDVATAPVSWSIAAEVANDIGWENGVLATHPTDPKTIAVKREISQFEPDVVVVISNDLGQTRTPVTVKTYANPGPGHYDALKGFGYDPTDGKRLAVLTQMPPTNPNPGPEPEWDTLVFGRSVNGGTSFDVPDLRTNPWPPDGMQLSGGKIARVAIRAQHVLEVSEDFGDTFNTVFEDSKQCLAHGGFAVSSIDEPLTFFMVCNATLLRCERAKSATKPTCAPATLPGGLTPVSVVIAPHEPTRVIVTGSGGIAVSSDGGKHFTRAVIAATTGAVSVVFDPRAGQKNVYALARVSNAVYRSIDGGRTFQDVTPPTDMKPPIATYARDIAVAADGALIALAHPGVIRLAPPQ